MKKSDVKSVAVIDDEMPNRVFIISDKRQYTIPLTLYREIRDGMPIAEDGLVIRPTDVINYLDEVNPLLFDAQVAREVDEQLKNRRKEEKALMFYAVILGVILICAALAYIMITKSAQVAVSYNSGGTGISVK